MLDHFCGKMSYSWSMPTPVTRTPHDHNIQFFKYHHIDPKVIRHSGSTTSRCLRPRDELLPVTGLSSFWKQKHIQTPPYHSASNELVERVVQTFKEGLWKLSECFTSRVDLWSSFTWTIYISILMTKPDELRSNRNMTTIIVQDFVTSKWVT